MFSVKWWFVSLFSLTVPNFKASNQLRPSRSVWSSCLKTATLHARNKKRFYLWFMKQVLKLGFHQNLYLNTTFTYTLTLNSLPNSVSSCMLFLPGSRNSCCGKTLWEKWVVLIDSLKFLYINVFFCRGRGWWNILHGKTLRVKWAVRTEWWQRRIMAMEIWRRKVGKIDTYRVHLKWTTGKLAWGGLICYEQLW